MLRPMQRDHLAAEGAAIEAKRQFSYWRLGMTYRVMPARYVDVDAHVKAWRGGRNWL